MKNAGEKKRNGLLRRSGKGRFQETGMARTRRGHQAIKRQAGRARTVPAVGSQGCGSLHRERHTCAAARAFLFLAPWGGCAWVDAKRGLSPRCRALRNWGLYQLARNVAAQPHAGGCRVNPDRRKAPAFSLPRWGYGIHTSLPGKAKRADSADCTQKRRCVNAMARKRARGVKQPRHGI